MRRFGGKMIPLTSLLLPIAVSAVLVFIASSLIHMVLPYHRSDYGRVPSEDEAMEALRRFSIAPGVYVMPAPGSAAEERSPEYIAKRAKGPIAMLTVFKPGPPELGMQLGLWFVYTLVVSVFVAYVTGLALGPDASYRSVFRIASTVAFMGYALSLPQFSIWFGRPWSITLKSVFDGLIYGLLTGGAFGWLWPE
jgi:hypothetical protein